MSKTASVLDLYPDYEINIGFEVHVQLTTKSKIFCSCPNKISTEPNKNICSTCAGHPGTLPVLNKEVIQSAILIGLATHSEIAKISEFARKHYFYPDLPKGYQTTQDDKPICKEGYVSIRLGDGSTKKVRLARIHIEEDAGKNIHADGGRESFVDLNRAGTPLLEIVTYPEISSVEEAREYLKTLRNLVMYLNICTGNMEDGAFRGDTNISVRKKGAPLGTKVELKNINSFKFIADAIEYETQRHIELLESGGKVKQETRLWNTKNRETVPMRSKEEAADYRYFSDPDLPLVEVNEELIERVQKTLPELPHDKFARFVQEKGLTPYEADILIEDREIADYFDRATVLSSSKQIVNWILRDVLGYLKENKLTLIECKVTPEKLAEIINLLENGIINGPAAKEVFKIVAETGESPEVVIEHHGLKQLDSVEELEAVVRDIVTANPEQVKAYKEGKDRLFGFFVGQAMQKTQGKGNPSLIQELLKKHLQ